MGGGVNVCMPEDSLGTGRGVVVVTWSREGRYVYDRFHAIVFYVNRAVKGVLGRVYTLLHTFVLSFSPSS